jgi:hypothetical protein
MMIFILYVYLQERRICIKIAFISWMDYGFPIALMHPTAKNYDPSVKRLLKPIEIIEGGRTVYTQH